MECVEMHDEYWLLDMVMQPQNKLRCHLFIHTFKYNLHTLVALIVICT